MSFPVPVKYLLNDNQDSTVVVYDDGKEIEGLPDPGCFSQENINKFASKWGRGELGPKVIITAPLSRGYAFTGNPFTDVLYLPDGEIGNAYSFAYSQISFNSIYVIPFANITGQRVFNYTRARIIDLGSNTIPAYTFAYCTFNVLILRNSNRVSLEGINAFGNTVFGSGGSGGEIYILKELYDHLGDGSALDYKAANNWSTVDGYGTITWRQIEGSEYEFNYADGTPIGSV